MRDLINARVKKREAFRPFAPAVLDDPPPSTSTRPSFAVHARDLPRNSPFDLPAITHVDQSARLQTVESRTNRRFALLLARFHERTGCPILLNTSFNMRGQPIVCTPLDAMVCFLVSPGSTASSSTISCSTSAHRWRGKRTELFLNRLASIAGDAGAQVIVVVPEFNLVDWREDKRGSSRSSKEIVLGDGRFGRSGSLSARWRPISRCGEVGDCTYRSRSRNEPSGVCNSWPMSSTRWANSKGA